MLIPVTASAQIEAGGVDKKGTWFVGEGLKKGDYFSYEMCHAYWKECIDFEMDFWIKGDKQVGTETKWLAEVVVYDGNKIIKGEMELGKIAPEPTGGSDYLSDYHAAFKSSIVWLSAYVTSDTSHATSGTASDKGPKKFSDVSWGKIANIGGQQILPTAIETITVPAGTWETVQVGWKTGGAESKIWIVDDFPFPIKAHTFTHVSEGIPPSEYIFELLEYRENVFETPFADIPDYISDAVKGCNSDIEKEVTIKKPTTNFDYQLHVFYGPEDPVVGCEIQFQINFLKKSDDTGFYNQVQYDILVVDDDTIPQRSVAKEEGRRTLYSPSGQALINVQVKEAPGIANYAIWIHGLAPKHIVPSFGADYLVIPITIYANDKLPSVPTPTTPPTPDPTPTPVSEIPSWIKQNAGWWADGLIDDGSFVSGIQFLIQTDVIKIPPTTQGTSGSTGEIPSWIKQNAGWWADGSIDDDSFVSGIQFLIQNGVLNIG